MSRDFQRSKLYKWERAVVAPRTNKIVKFDDAQTFIDGVWMSLGLIGAPRVELMSLRNKKADAAADRVNIYLKGDTPAWIVIHEIAHSLNRQKTRGSWIYDGAEDCDGHGPKFVGEYIRLLDRVLGIPLCLTQYSLGVHGVKYEV